jgi:hypothetical protein
MRATCAARGAEEEGGGEGARGAARGARGRRGPRGRCGRQSKSQSVAAAARGERARARAARPAATLRPTSAAAAPPPPPRPAPRDGPGARQPAKNRGGGPPRSFWKYGCIDLTKSSLPAPSYTFITSDPPGRRKPEWTKPTWPPDRRGEAACVRAYVRARAPNTSARVCSRALLCASVHETTAAKRAEGPVTLPSHALTREHQHTRASTNTRARACCA